MNDELAEIGAAFQIPGRFAGAVPVASGHIHKTFTAAYRDGARSARYTHQRLNDRVFPDLAALMDNLVRITRHHWRLLEAGGVPDAERRSLQLVPARDGRPYHVAPDGGTWRTFRFLEGARSLETIQAPGQAYQVARAFGRFAAALRDLPPPPLAVTIPGFHDLRGRFESFQRAVEADSHNRAEEALAEIDRAADCFRDLDRRLDAAGLDGLPRRVVHNDCKVDNVMVDDASGEGLCVIDLDTVMEGTVLCDFGELVRTGTSRSPEDEVELDSIRFDVELFRAATRGYLAGAAPLLTGSEVEILPLAGPAMALENAIRFLTDHLNGDVYFRIHREGQNLDRFRAQLRRVELMGEQRDRMRAIVEEAWRAGREGLEAPPRD